MRGETEDAKASSARLQRATEFLCDLQHNGEEFRYFRNQHLIVALCQLYEQLRRRSHDRLDEICEAAARRLKEKGSPSPYSVA